MSIRQSFPWNRLEPIIWWFVKRGLWDYWPFRYTAAKQLEKLLSSLNPDLIVIGELWLYPYLSVVKRHSGTVIFDHHNVEAILFEATKCQGHGLRGWLRSKLHLPQIRTDEHEFMRQADQTWVCSHNDKTLLHELYGNTAQHTKTDSTSQEISSTYVVPNAINLDNYAQIRLKQYPLSTELDLHCKYVLYLGNFGYIPNAEAADLLVRHIYPQLKGNYPDCRLLLVGRDPTPAMLDAAQKDRDIIVTGQVPDIKPYLAAGSVMVVPLRKGSGTRFKVLEAFAAHCPVVSTAKGIEGLNVDDNKHLLIRESAADIAAGVMQIWEHPKQTETMITAGYELVQAEYSWEAAGLEVHRALKKIFPSL